jgi:hypothetical protein
MPRDYKPPSAKSVSMFLYILVLVGAAALAYLAVRALLA